MNPYVKNINRIEFVVTFACTGRCKHCSEGDHTNNGERINGDIAADMIRKVAGHYDIKSLMTFGGEPLLYPEEVCKIQAAARDVGIVERQLITNGFFSRDERKIRQVVNNLAQSGVNELLLSVDAFHQETIPIDPVITFAKAVQEMKISRFRVHPAWLVNMDADNPYNHKTKEILSIFHAMGIPISSGNDIFPGGNALKYLREYFDLGVSHKNKYAENPQDIKAICLHPNGHVLDGSIYKTDIMDILENYNPDGMQ